MVNVEGICFQPELQDVLIYIAGVLGLFNHYLLPQLRKEMPWLYMSKPMLSSHERSHYEVTRANNLFIT